MGMRLGWLGCSFGAASLLGACAAQGTPSTEADATTQQIIGGVPAGSSALDAVGTLGFSYTYEDWETGEPVTGFDPFCTATLIGPRTLVTAKHCIEVFTYYADAYNVPGFGIGPDGFAPSRILEVIDIEGAPLDEGGFIGYGSDVAVAHLAEPAGGLKPLKFRKLQQAQVGERMAVVGYGVQDNAGTYGTRSAGAVTINALSGRFYELVFGTYESFLDWWEQNEDVFFEAAPEADEDWEDEDWEDEDWWDWGPEDEYELELLQGYEAWVGYQYGDAQDCYGDSGGPLVKANDKGALQVYGVVSGGLYSNELVCDFGSVHAIFGPDTLAFLKEARAWVDPCDGLTTAGSCDGDLAMRCSRMQEGPRRPLIMDCSLLAQTCAVGADGKATCVVPGEQPPVLVPDYPGEEDYEEITYSVRAKVAEDFLGPGSAR